MTTPAPGPFGPADLSSAARCSNARHPDGEGHPWQNPADVPAWRRRARRKAWGCACPARGARVVQVYLGGRLAVSRTRQAGGAPIVDETRMSTPAGEFAAVAVRAPIGSDRNLTRPNRSAKPGTALVLGWLVEPGGLGPWWTRPAVASLGIRRWLAARLGITPGTGSTLGTVNGHDHEAEAVAPPAFICTDQATTVPPADPRYDLPGSSATPLLDLIAEQAADPTTEEVLQTEADGLDDLAAADRLAGIGQEPRRALAFLYAHEAATGKPTPTRAAAYGPPLVAAALCGLGVAEWRPDGLALTATGRDAARALPAYIWPSGRCGDPGKHEAHTWQTASGFAACSGYKHDRGPGRDVHHSGCHGDECPCYLDGRADVLNDLDEASDPDRRRDLSAEQALGAALARTACSPSIEWVPPRAILDPLNDAGWGVHPLVGTREAGPFVEDVATVIDGAVARGLYSDRAAAVEDVRRMLHAPERPTAPAGFVPVEALRLLAARFLDAGTPDAPRTLAGEHSDQTWREAARQLQDLADRRLSTAATAEEDLRALRPYVDEGGWGQPTAGEALDALVETYGDDALAAALVQALPLFAGRHAPTLGSDVPGTGAWVLDDVPLPEGVPHALAEGAPWVALRDPAGGSWGTSPELTGLAKLREQLALGAAALATSPDDLDDLYGALHTARETLCLVERPLREWWIAAGGNPDTPTLTRIGRAVQMIDRAGSTWCRQWSTSDRTHEDPEVRVRQGERGELDVLSLTPIIEPNDRLGEAARRAQPNALQVLGIALGAASRVGPDGRPTGPTVLAMLESVGWAVAPVAALAPVDPGYRLAVLPGSPLGEALAEGRHGPERSERDVQDVERLITADLSGTAAIAAAVARTEPGTRPHADRAVKCWCWSDPDPEDPHPRPCRGNRDPHEAHTWWDDHEPDATRWACPGIATQRRPLVGSPRPSEVERDLAATPQPHGLPGHECGPTCPVQAERDRRHGFAAEVIDGPPEGTPVVPLRQVTDDPQA